MADSGNYFQSSLQFLKELVPDISVDLFENLHNITSPMLNILFHLGWKLYGELRFKPGRLISLLISIYNFYCTTVERILGFAFQ